MGRQTSAPLMQTLEQAGVAPQIVYEGRRVDLILVLNQKMGISIMMNHSFDLAGYENVVAVPIHPKQYSQLAFIKRQANQSSQCVYSQQYSGKLENASIPI